MSVDKDSHQIQDFELLLIRMLFSHLANQTDQIKRHLDNGHPEAAFYTLSIMQGFIHQSTLAYLSECKKVHAFLTDVSGLVSQYLSLVNYSCHMTDLNHYRLFRNQFHSIKFSRYFPEVA